MTTDLTLVTRREPTMTDVRDGIKAARRDAGLGVPDVVGDWGDGDPLVEISAEVSDNELLLQLFRPTASLTTAANPYSVDLGLAPPLDDQQQCWLTAGAMSALATDEQILAALGVIRHLLLATEGYLVVNGGYAELDGVPAPQKIIRYPTPPKKVPPARAFWRAYSPTPGLDETSWTWAMNLLREVLADHPDLRPMLIEEDGEWRPFLPGRPAPAWWPASQYLLTVDPYVRWSVRCASGPAERYSELDLRGDLSPEATQAMLPELLALAGNPTYGLDYGLVHAWHPDEEVGPRGLKLSESGPILALNSHDFTGRFLPNLFWAQVFGPPWVELFGADTIASTPAHRVEEIAPDHWLIQLTDRLADVVEDHDTFEQARVAAKTHLGNDAFYNTELGLNGPYRVPHIPTLAERGLVPYPDA